MKKKKEEKEEGKSGKREGSDRGGANGGVDGGGAAESTEVERRCEVDSDSSVSDSDSCAEEVERRGEERCEKTNRLYVVPGSPSKKISPRIQGRILFKQVKPIRSVPAAVEPRKMQLNYRSNIAKIVKIVSTSRLTEAHRVHLQRTPFWLMFEAILENDLKTHEFRKCDELVFKLIQTYVSDTGCFHIGNGKLTLRDNDIRLIFGLQCGGQPLLMTPGPRPPSDFIQRRFGLESHISSKLVKTLFCDAVQSTSARDVKDAIKLITLYVYVKLFFSTSDESVSWTLIRIIDKLYSMKLYDWIGAIRSALLGSVKEFHRILGKITGCVVVLLYFLCEHTTLVVADRPEVFSRFLKWNVGTLLARMRNMTQDDVDKFEVLPGRLQVSKYERDQLLSGNNVVDDSDDGFVDRIDMIDDVHRDEKTIDARNPIVNVIAGVAPI
ncbi:hypothetical protein LOK49_LG06G02637 [Camellia lanceoleosa]|uniref:Uncharacterized protein n=1 Tax=Camellia lanceoleosa TaxID=1840588 RepID=A0ACC0H932_9ERIC|nr:hypothetical protein LOK49_LG06G02637 [Camellia lanceoleosa]